ncbi:PfkB family carbohydrate kinase [Sphingobacterium litopenaei]|uniref:Bifunctional heptose 7-phosphate kinase/heptose 1-phosphate adenyltransferase n=1 Tax=Sphingobacterium litopenaei TaxID=2763500 RepID=A0ABR7YGT6_9SPHI|nr:PfkB family carbohydrate kinase [Sphingobacterium litopenaei]MBD1430530.1 bifunctional heptose 7-phosphate kinase/heptose 1-phosphate adenyltransferase [Sphingobacterium litopenaei]
MERDIINKLNNFKDKHILVIGDFILDAYVDTQCERLAPEASVPVLDITKTTYSLGGAANVAYNLEKLGSKVSLLTVLGQDDNSKKAIQLFKSNPQKSLYLHFSAEDQTLCKTRIHKDGQLLYRLDEGKHLTLENDQMDLFLKDLRELYLKCDAVYIADYNKGAIHYKVIDLLEELKSMVYKPIVIDSKNYLQYRNIQPCIIKPNYKEALELTHEKAHNDRIKQAPYLTDKLMEISKAKLVALTLDKDGVYVSRRNGSQFHIETCQVEVQNSSGAGDIFLSTLLLNHLVEIDDINAAKIACQAASIGIQKEATAHCTWEELKASLIQESGKVIINSENLAELVKIKGQDKTVVLTTGCFDIFHSGHATFLKQAKEQGDILIVGINIDESIARLKGPDRPVNTLMDRMEVLKALSYIDYIVPFGDQDDTPISLIKTIKPHVFVKGEDYQSTVTPEKKTLMSLGIKQVFIPLVPHQSTTKIINRVQGNTINLKKIG